jgi:hypothetical protein
MKNNNVKKPFFTARKEAFKRVSFSKINWISFHLVI